MQNDQNNEKTVKYITIKKQPKSVNHTKSTKSSKSLKITNFDESDEDISLKFSDKKLIDTSVTFNDDTDSNGESDDRYDKEKTNKDGSIRLQYTEPKPPNPSSILTSANEIKEKLQNFSMVNRDKIKDLPVGTFIRYVEVLTDGTYRYKPGGAIKVNKAPEYLVLISNNKSWSVQLAKHIIFSERFQDVRNALEKENEKLKRQVGTLRKTIIELSEKNVALEKLAGICKNNTKDINNTKDKNIKVDKNAKVDKNIKVDKNAKVEKIYKNATANN